MKKQLVATLVISTLPLIFVSCVSSLLKDAPPSFSTEIQFKAPEAPFTKYDTSVYPSWKNTSTGNIISIISDCRPNSPYKLTNIHQVLESSLENIKVIKEENYSFQDKPAYSRVVKAQLDGEPIEINSVAFKRKSCHYVAVLSGKQNNLSVDKAHFEKFMTGFGFK